GWESATAEPRGGPSNGSSNGTSTASFPATARSSTLAARPRSSKTSPGCSTETTPTAGRRTQRPLRATDLMRTHHGAPECPFAEEEAGRFLADSRRRCPKPAQCLSEIRGDHPP